MPHLAMWFKYSGGGLKDIKVSLCGLLYSKKQDKTSKYGPDGR